MRREQQNNGSDKSEPEIIDGQTGLVCPTPRTINLSNLRDVRLALAHVHREIDAGRIKSQEETRRAYVLRQTHITIRVPPLLSGHIVLQMDRESVPKTSR